MLEPRVRLFFRLGLRIGEGAAVGSLFVLFIVLCRAKWIVF